MFWVQDRLTDLFVYLHAPAWLHGALVLGVYRVLAWVVSVMLPPMAIFFPLFTLLEDLGYLPRVAFNLDKHFQKCRRLRQTGAYHVHGVWLQRSRRCGMPDHRFSARTAHCHLDQQFCALQRPFPDVLPKGKKKNGFMYCQDMFKIVYFYKYIEHDINLRKTAEKPRKFAIYTNIAPKTKKYTF